MSNRAKKLAAILAAALAIAAAQTSAATAVPLFHSEVAPTIGKGSQVTQIIFTVNAGQIACKTVTGEGVIAAKTVTEATFATDYANCTAFGFINVPIHENGCHGVVTADIEAHLVCPAGKQLEATVPGCTIKVGPQSATSIEYENVGTGSTREIIAREEGVGIHYIECGSTYTNGKAVGTVRTKGFDQFGKQVGIWWTDE